MLKDQTQFEMIRKTHLDNIKPFRFSIVLLETIMNKKHLTCCWVIWISLNNKTVWICFCRDGRIKIIGGDNIEGLLISPNKLPYKILEVRKAEELLWLRSFICFIYFFMNGCCMGSSFPLNVSINRRNLQFKELTWKCLR